MFISDHKNSKKKRNVSRPRSQISTIILKFRLQKSKIDHRCDERTPLSHMTQHIKYIH